MPEQRVQADPVIFNTALNGCCFCLAPGQQVQRLTSLGLKPTATTLSVVVNALSEQQSWDTELKYINSVPV